MNEPWENKNTGGTKCPNCGKRVHCMTLGTKCGHCRYDFKTKSAPITGKPITRPETS